MQTEIEATFTIEENDQSVEMCVSIGPGSELVDLSGYAIAAILENFPIAFVDALRKAHAANQMLGKLLSHTSFIPNSLDDESMSELEDLLAKLAERGGKG